MRAIGIAIPFFRRRSGVPIDAQAQAHFNRVIADGGVVPSGLSGVNAFFSAVKAIYGTSDINTAISAAYDAHYLGYKLGAGSGTTLGQAAQKLYSCSGASGDVVQTTAASQPLLLAHTGENYWFSPRVAGNYCVTPNSAAIQISGDVEDIYYLDVQNIVNFQGLFTCQNSSPDNGYNIYINTSGRLVFDTTIKGAATSSASISTGLQYIKINRQASSGDVKFYTSSDGVTYTQLGTTQSTTSGNLTAPTRPLTLGIFPSFTDFPFQGKIYRATRSNSIGGTPVVDFNPASYNPVTSQTQWSSATGEVWSISTGTATTGYKGVLVDRTIVQGDGIDDTISSGTVSSYQYMTRYAGIRPYTMDNNGRRIIAGTGNGHLYYYFNTGAVRAFSGADLDFSGEVINNLQLFTANYNSASSSIKVNNANNVNGDTGTLSSTQVCVFSSSSPNQFSNAGLTTLLHTVSVDTSNNTAIYNYLRSINNNAF